MENYLYIDYEIRVRLVEELIDAFQAQYNTEGITEIDSGEALIRPVDAIFAVKDNLHVK